jgi:hypothetical protein
VRDVESSLSIRRQLGGIVRGPISAAFPYEVGPRSLHPRVNGLLGNATQLLISPDSDLNLIPFQALLGEDGHYLVQRYFIGYLSTGRDLLRLQIVRSSKRGPLVVADPTFGEPSRLPRWLGRTRRTRILTPQKARGGASPLQRTCPPFTLHLCMAPFRRHTRFSLFFPRRK